MDNQSFINSYKGIINNSGFDLNELIVNGTDIIEAIEQNQTDISSNLTAINTERGQRISADSILTTNLNNEIGARTTADTAEATARALADTTLQTNITAEASTRATADTTLQTNINTNSNTIQDLNRTPTLLTINNKVKLAEDTDGDYGLLFLDNNGIINKSIYDTSSISSLLSTQTLFNSIYTKSATDLIFKLSYDTAERNVKILLQENPNFGFEIMYEGTANDFIIRRNNGGGITDCLTIDRNTGLITFNETTPDRMLFVNSSKILSTSSSLTQSTLTTNITNTNTNTSNIANLTPRVEQLETDLSIHDTQIDTNTANISTNTANISTNTSAISTNTSAISTNTSAISTNTSAISTNTSAISTTATNLSNYISAPIITKIIPNGEVSGLYLLETDVRYGMLIQYQATPNELVILAKTIIATIPVEIPIIRIQRETQNIYINSPSIYLTSLSGSKFLIIDGSNKLVESTMGVSNITTNTTNISTLLTRTNPTLKNKLTYNNSTNQVVAVDGTSIDTDYNILQEFKASLISLRKILQNGLPASGYINYRYINNTGLATTTYDILKDEDLLMRFDMDNDEWSIPKPFNSLSISNFLTTGSYITAFGDITSYSDLIIKNLSAETKIQLYNTGTAVFTKSDSSQEIQLHTPGGGYGFSWNLADTERFDIYTNPTKTTFTIGYSSTSKIKMNFDYTSDIINIFKPTSNVKITLTNFEQTMVNSSITSIPIYKLRSDGRIETSSIYYKYPTGTGHYGIKQLNTGNGYIYEVVYSPLNVARTNAVWGRQDASYVINFSGNVLVNGSTVHTSDERIKTDITDSTKPALEIINKIQIKEYIYKYRPNTEGKKVYGVIAQQIKEDIDNVYNTDIIGEHDEVSSLEQTNQEISDLLSIKKENIFMLLVGAVQELTTKLNETNEKYEALLTRVQNLENV